MSLAKLIRQSPLVSFVILNYAISWIFLYPAYQAILRADGGFPLMALFGIPGGFGPSIAAIIVVGCVDGRRGIYKLLGRIKIIRIHLKWYLFVLILPAFIYLLSLLGTSLLGFSIGHPDMKEGFVMFFPYLLIALPFGPIMEELGWRGFMFPELLRKYNVFKSSIILGITWSVWHLVSFTFPGAAIPSVFQVNGITIGLYILSIMAETFLFSYVYLRTNGNLIIAILFHAAFNASSNVILAVFPTVEEAVDQRMALFAINIILMALTAIILFSNLNKKSDSNIKA
jgi:membrane protease YdiL (CAAX protease family)